MTKNDNHQFKLLSVLIKHFLTTIDPLIFYFACAKHYQGQCSCFLNSIANAPFRSEGQCHPLCSSNQVINIALNCY